jgi:hypothetical protein
LEWVGEARRKKRLSHSIRSNLDRLSTPHTPSHPHAPHHLFPRPHPLRQFRPPPSLDPAHTTLNPSCADSLFATPTSATVACWGRYTSPISSPPSAHPSPWLPSHTRSPCRVRTWPQSTAREGEPEGGEEEGRGVQWREVGWGREGRSSGGGGRIETWWVWWCIGVNWQGEWVGVGGGSGEVVRGRRRRRCNAWGQGWGGW